MMEREARLMNILRAPIISEKGNLVSDKSNTASFKVLRDASKGEIKQAVEKIFGVTVTSVNTINVAGKARRSAHGMGRRSDWKKAYVQIQKGQQVDLDSALADKESK